MKILILTNNPNRPSFRQRIEVYMDRLRESGIVCEFYKLPKNLLSRWKLFSKARRFDAVLLHKKTLNFWDMAILRYFSRRIIYDFDDAVMYSHNRPDSDRTSHRRLFRRTAGNVDVMIAGNDYLARQASGRCKDVVVVPTGLDTTIFREQTKQLDDGCIRLVWIGSQSTIKYLESIVPALEIIGQKYDTVILRIICDVFLDLEQMPVEKCPWSLESQIPDLVNSDIGLAPLEDTRFARGKCGFKILQYAAASLPTVASPVGVNAEYVQPGQTGYHADSIQKWVNQLSLLIEDHSGRVEMGQKARLFSQAYDLDVIGEKFVDIVRSKIES